MKSFILMLEVIVGTMAAIVYPQSMEQHDNPFFRTYTTPFQVPPFDQIRAEHFLPAFQRGMEEQEREIDAIANNPAEPTFANTVEALERSGDLLKKVSNVFFALRSANTNDELQAIAKEIAPRLSRHRDNIYLNEALFKRISVLYEKRSTLQLTAEQLRLLEEIYLDFVRSGATLSPEKKQRFREINEELSLLSLKFEENVLKETNAFKLVIDNERDLAGLPQDVRTAAAETAVKNGLPGKWVFTLHKPSLIPFLQYAENRSLRERLFTAYIKRGDNNNEYDNKEIVAKIAALRVERAHLLGYRTHAEFVLERNMAKTPEAVYEFLKQLWTPALAAAQRELAEMKSLTEREGTPLKFEARDWWYYAEKIRKAKYELDENELRAYFKLENVRKGAFDVASKLYGLQFIQRRDVPTYHPEVEVYEVRRTDGTHVGLLFTDYYPRPGKRAGAWMGSFRVQHRIGDSIVTPLIYNVGNFTRPTAEKPSLLSFEEVETLFHEFGHALHGLLSNVTYKRLAGTAVPRDFVELPSQIMEHWASEPEVLRTYAFHYSTGEPIPDALIEKIQRSRTFNQGFATVEYLAASFLDMDWHTLTTTQLQSTNEFEKASLQRIGLIPEIVVRYRSTYFSHIFGGGYSAGYYSYIWVEVLDSDAFEAFKEKGLFDRQTAQAFLKNVLERGGTDDPMKLYIQFRGRKPTIDALLKNRGLL